MLTIYTPQTTNRIRYIFDLIFIETLEIDYQIVNDLVEFGATSGPKFSYSKDTSSDHLSFWATSLLFEKGIKEQKISVKDYEDTKVFFNTSDTNSCLPFDPFAASFYLISRYEEYLLFKSDKYGRFPAEESVAFQCQFLHKPVVNYYIRIIGELLKQHFPKIKTSPGKYKFIPTYDIDSAFEYANKGLIRSIGGFLKSLSNRDWNTLSDRLKVLLGLRKDPFNNYDWMEQIHQEYNLSPVYFFLVGDYDEFDKNVSISIIEFQQLITSIADSAEVGIHPSYASNANTEKLEKEIKQLSAVLKRDIKKSRQHFLKLKFPGTYQQLAEHDIIEDFTMGYPSQLGFRASICTPFYFYNLENENKTQLKILPFAIMDASLKYYLNYSPNEAIEAMKPIINEIKEMNGTFVSLWHNSSFSNEKEWVGWKKVYVEMIKTATE